MLINIVVRNWDLDNIGIWDIAVKKSISDITAVHISAMMFDFDLWTLPGIYGVGKAAEHPPALAVLSHTPEGATQTIAWVGKGIVYDTGGLSIKGKVRLAYKLNCHHCFSFQVASVADACINPDSHQTTMPGMKRDCGGAAAILGAFKATIKQVGWLFFLNDAYFVCFELSPLFDSGFQGQPACSVLPGRKRSGSCCHTSWWHPHYVLRKVRFQILHLMVVTKELVAKLFWLRWASWTTFSTHVCISVINVACLFNFCMNKTYKGNSSSSCPTVKIDISKQ